MARWFQLRSPRRPTAAATRAGARGPEAKGALDGRAGADTPGPRPSALGPQRSQRGFTLVELIVVMAIIALLAGIAVPASRHIMARSREAVLRHNLAQIREMIDQYYADKQKYPEQLSDLVSEGGYFRRIPKDPITGKDDWEVVKLSDVAEEEDLGQGESEEDGIWDVHSKAEGKGLDGTPYKEW